MQSQTTLLPLPDDLPSFSQAMDHLGRVPLLLFQGLEQAADKTATFREAECPGERLDEGLAAGLLRFHANRFLRDKGIDAELDDEWGLDWMPFMGISFHYKTYHVRLLKGQRGCLPGCSDSEKKKRFYGQIPTLYLSGGTVTKTTANLLVLWDFNQAYGLSGLWLALPAIGGARPGDVSAYWCEQMPHPSEGLMGVTPPLPPPDDDLSGMVQPLTDEQDKRKAQ